MQYLRISFEAVMPLFFPMALGYIMRKANQVPESAIPAMNNLVFRVFIPIMLFCNIYGNAVTFNAYARLLSFILCGITILFILLSLMVPRFVQEPSRRGTLIQGIMRSNTAIYGMPIGLSILGNEYAPIISIVIATIVIPFNLFSILTLEINRDKKPEIKQILYKIAANPLIVLIVLALLCNQLRISLPPLLLSCMRQVGSITTPFSFFVLGASFTFSAAAKNRKALTVSCFLKLIAAPLFYIVPAILLGFQGFELILILLVCAPPTAVSSYPMASAMGGDSELASELVVFTSALSMITMFLWTYALQALSL